MYHFLDGYAIVSKFNFKDGKVTLTKRFVESDAYKRALAAKKPLINEFGTRGFPDPNKSFFGRFAAALVPGLNFGVTRFGHFSHCNCADFLCASLSGDRKSVV